MSLTKGKPDCARVNRRVSADGVPEPASTTGNAHTKEEHLRKPGLDRSLASVRHQASVRSPR
eukprot:6125638-Pleurochrysis_carterae.AAC.1